MEVVHVSAAPDENTLSAPPRLRRRLLTAAGRRSVPLGFMVLVVATTLAYSMLWAPLVKHQNYWITPGDLWGTFRSAQWVAWGDIGDVYKGGTGLVTFPGISVLLAPVALVVNHFNLSIGFPYGLVHPQSWPLLGTYEALIGSIVLIPLDGLAEQLGLSKRARLVASFCEAVLVFPVLGIWGHPEDPVALAFALWALLCAMRGKWRWVGWLLGAAIATQPLVVVMAPLLFAVSPVREWLKTAVRTALPSFLLLAIPLVQSWQATTTALLKQPNFPQIDHPTPWLALAPVLSKTHLVHAQRFYQTTHADGSIFFGVLNSVTRGGEVVAAGPGRLIAIALAAMLGVYAYRRPPRPAQLVWLCTIALALRCFFESVMDPFYLWPGLAVAFVLVAREASRFVVAVPAAGALTWWSYRHLSPWDWWLPVVALLTVVLVAAVPRRSAAEAPVISRPRAGWLPWGRRSDTAVLSG